MPSDTERRTMRGYDVEIVRSSHPPGIVSAKAHIYRGTLVVATVVTPTGDGDADWLIWAKLDTYASGWVGFTGSLEQAIAKLLDEVEPAYPVTAGPEAAR